MPEIGQTEPKKLKALAGLAPYAKDSGLWRGQRSIRGGRRRVRCALYLAALVGVRFNPTLKAFYKRLVDGGKAKKSAILAAAAKLLTILNSMVKQNVTWDPARAIAA